MPCKQSSIYGLVACIALVVSLIIMFKNSTSYTTMFINCCCTCLSIMCVSYLIGSQCNNPNQMIPWLMACVCICSLCSGIFTQLKQLI